jgi:hypothetical protein
MPLAGEKRKMPQLCASKGHASGCLQSASASTKVLLFVLCVFDDGAKRYSSSAVIAKPRSVTACWREAGITALQHQYNRLEEEPKKAKPM